MRRSYPFMLFILICVFAVTPATAHEIHDAAQAGDLAKVRSLLEANPNLLEIKNENEKTPMHFAAESGSVELIGYLLDKGADVNAKNVADETPLHYASGWCHLEAVKLLLERKADVSIITNEGDTPLHYLRFVGLREVAELLLDSGADINARNNAGEAFLGMAVNSGRPQLIDLAFDRGAKIQPGQGMRMLIDAAVAGNVSLVDRILGNDVEVKAEGEDGARLLYAAAAMGHKQLVEELISKGADIRALSPQGGTLLHSAARGDLFELGERLIAEKIDIDATDLRGRTALHISQDWGNADFQKMLEKAGARDLPRPVIWLSKEVSDKESSDSLEVSYIANEGFYITTPAKTIIIDALIQNPWGYLNTPAPVFAKIKDAAAPFERLDLLLFSHAHRDHYEPNMAFELMKSRKQTILVGNSITVGELEEAAGTDFSAVKARTRELNPDWGTTRNETVSGVRMKVFPVNHGDPDRPYVTLAYLMYLEGFTVLHLGDISPPSNVEYFPKFGLEKEAIDIAFIDPFFLQNEAGQKLLKDYIRPQKIILMHMRPNETDRYATELGQAHDNILVFHEPMEKKIFRKARR
ncbi:MAG: ankyrin repeat domain-containing protein [Candidatus Aminicenantaceae bacterium]